MSPAPAWSRSARRFLATHIARLSDRLVDLADELRSSVAQVVGQVVVGAVREAITTFINARDAMPSHPTPSRSWSDQDPYRRDSDHSLLDDWYDAPAKWDELEEEEDLPVSGSPSTASPSRWHTAVAFGCQATAWWLRRTAGRCTKLATATVALACTGAAYLAGSGIATSALSAVAFVEAVQCSGSLLTLLGRL